jgi:septal ring factor EnvC (AmiA/AmiB activator)
MLFTTTTQYIALAVALVAGWLFGLASHPGGRKWKARYAAERDAHAATNKRVTELEREHDVATRRATELERDHGTAGTRVAELERERDTATQRATELERHVEELRRENDRLATARPVVDERRLHDDRPLGGDRYVEDDRLSPGHPRDRGFI